MFLFQSDMLQFFYWWYYKIASHTFDVLKAKKKKNQNDTFTNLSLNLTKVLFIFQLCIIFTKFVSHLNFCIIYQLSWILWTRHMLVWSPSSCWQWLSPSDKVLRHWSTHSASGQPGIVPVHSGSLSCTYENKKILHSDGK